MSMNNNHLTKSILKRKLQLLEKTLHPAYTMMRGLPKTYCYILHDSGSRTIDRDHDHDRDYDRDEAELQDLLSPDRMSFDEFFQRYREFDAEDEFMLCLSVHLDKIDSSRIFEYVETLYIEQISEFTPDIIGGLFDNFLEFFCERRLRDNEPFDLTPATIREFGFTAADVEELKGPIGKYNAGARMMMWAEYDALRRLDFIREGKL